MSTPKHQRTEFHGDRNISIGGNVIQSILITGDHNQVFVGQYERLQDAYIPPWSVFERVRLDHFAGREWITREINTFLQDNDRGVFLLEAAAGLGKTTFLAHLTKERGFIHHFVELAPGDGGVATGLRNLAAQLIRAWGLEQEIGGALPDAASRPDYLQNLLFKASDARDKLRPEEPIILVVDALDEAGTPVGQNVLGLPRVLPKGVYFIVSQRQVDSSLRVETPPRIFRWEAESGENLDDMRAYLVNAATRDGISKALADNGYQQDQFVETMLEKSNGVWIYLHYILSEIDEGKCSPLDLEALPKGLWQYYSQYWRRWRDQEEVWDEIYLPLLCALAAVQEGLPLPILCALAGLGETPKLKRLLEEHWRPFLAIETRKNIHYYRLYHASLRDFIEGRVDFEQLIATERNLTEELTDATRDAHTRIVERYLTAWGGLENGLPRLRNIKQQKLDGGYGLRHLVTHLLGAGELDKTINLLRVEWSTNKDFGQARRILGDLFDQILSREHQTQARYENGWYITHESVGYTDGYLTDVGHVWEHITRTNAQLAQDGQDVSYLGDEILCALIQVSVNSLAGNLHPKLIAQLVQSGIWLPNQALSHVCNVLDEKQRVDALIQLGPYMSDKLLKTAYNTAKKLQDKDACAHALAGLAPYLSDDLLIDALEVSRKIDKEIICVQVLAGLAPYLSDELLGIAFTTAKEMKDADVLAHALAGLAPYLSDDLLIDALEVSRKMDKETACAHALAGLVPHLSDELLRNALIITNEIRIKKTRAQTRVRRATLSNHNEVYAAASELQYAHKKALSGLFPLLVELGHHEEALNLVREALSPFDCVQIFLSITPKIPEDILGVALIVIREIMWEDERARALSSLAPKLPKELLDDALIIVKKIRDNGDRTIALASLSHLLSEELLIKTLVSVKKIPDESECAVSIANLAPYLPRRMLNKALAIAKKISTEPNRAQALASLAPYLGEKLLKKALFAARKIDDESVRAHYLVDLAPSLSDDLRNESLVIAKEIWDANARNLAFAGLAPHLPDAMRKQILEEALAITWDIHDESDRKKTLEFLDSYISDNAQKNILTTNRIIHITNSSAQILHDLAPNLSQEQLKDALSTAREIVDAETRVLKLADIATRLPESLRKDVLKEALETVKQIWRKPDRTRVLTYIGPHLPKDLQADVLREILASTTDTQDENTRAIALASLISYHPEHLQEQTLYDVLTTSLTVQDNDTRSLVLSILVPQIVTFPHPLLYHCWESFFPYLIRNTRIDFLSDLRTLTPIIATLGGEKAILDTCNSIRLVGRWWP